MSTRQARMLPCALALATGVAAALPTVADAQRSPRCALAEALAERNLRERAINEYVELLRANPRSRCALTGLARLTVRRQCAFPDALARAKLRSRAINAYVRILRTTPASKCARKGLDRLTRRQEPAVPPPPEGKECSVADGLRNAGRATEAETAYVELLKANASLTCAQQGLADLRVDQCDLAAFSAEQGDDEAAKAIYTALLKQQPAEPCAREGIEALEEETLPVWATEFTSDVVAVAGAASLLGATVLALLFLAGRPTRVGDFLHRRAVVGNFFAPRIALGKLTAAASSDSDSFTAALRSGLYRLAARDKSKRGPSVDGVTTYQGLGPAISSLAEAAGPFKAAGALASLMAEIKPRRRFTLNGALREGGAEVTAALEEKGSVKSTTTLGAASPAATGDPAGDLALVLAAWAHFEMRRLGRARVSAHTENAASFAFLDAGLALETRGNDAGAERMYRSALEIDGRNIGAWIALGNLRCKDGVTLEGVLMYRWAVLLAEAQT